MGEAGIGKSRLLLEFQRRLADEPVTWLTGRCISYGKEMAYLPIIDLLKHNFQVEEETTTPPSAPRLSRAWWHSERNSSRLSRISNTCCQSPRRRRRPQYGCPAAAAQAL